MLKQGDASVGWQAAGEPARGTGPSPLQGASQGPMCYGPDKSTEKAVSPGCPGRLPPEAVLRFLNTTGKEDKVECKTITLI